MKKLLASQIANAVAQIERVTVLVAERKTTENWPGDDPVPVDVRNHIAKIYDTLAGHAEAMDAPVTGRFAKSGARRLRKRKKPVTFNDMESNNIQLGNVLGVELEGVEFYCLNRGAAAFYSPTEPLFGREADARIPKASDDISEAGKCFAVGRYTASVFHLMRAMEAAVQKISEALKIENVDREWGKLLSDIHKKIEPMPKGDSRDDWSQVHANLYHVKQAWRNDTMHPKATYTEEEAREVFDAMKAFMRHLATLLPPSPEEIIG